MCLRSFLSYLEDNLSKAIDHFAKDNQLDIIHGSLEIYADDIENRSLDDIITTHQELSKKKTTLKNDDVTTSQKCLKVNNSNTFGIICYSEEVNRLVKKLETLKKPVLIIKL